MTTAADRTDVLLEVGVEEIPHRFIPDALADLRARFELLLLDAALPHDAIEVHATPRRLVVIVRNVVRRQADRSEELLGPPADAAFRDGAPTKAAEGFARKAGVDVGALRRVATDKGERVAATRHVAGRTVEEVLGDAAPAAFTAIPWPKNMRWAGGEHSWVRPVHWIVALAGSDVFGVALFGVTSGRTSRGHRARGSEHVAIPSVGEYFHALREARVMADRGERLRVIREDLGRAAATLSADVLPDDALIESAADLVEWPVVVVGSFPEEYLSLPDVVLSTAMRVHQKFFALTGADGRLLPKFLHVAGKDDPDDTIARNNASVLVARLADCRFYFESDLKTSMSERVEQLSGVLFQEKLGTYRDKVRRMEALASRVLALLEPQWTADRSASDLLRAVELCKVDQTTHVVKEFTELQGLVGAIYLQREGASADTWRAVEEHYLPMSLTDPVPSSRFGALLSVIDKLDTLVGCFGVGLVPTGSKDPFGLRRAAQGFVRTLMEASIDLRVSDLLEAACEPFAGIASFQQARVGAELVPYLEGRLRFLLTEGLRLAEGGGSFPQDEVAAVLGASWDRMPDVLARTRALHAVRRKRAEDFEALSVAFKRVRNIVKGAERSPQPMDLARLVEPAEQALAEQVRACSHRLAGRALVSADDYGVELEALAGLRPHVDRFFDEVLVMTEDDAVRRNRIALLREIEALFLRVADISEIAPRPDTQRPDGQRPDAPEAK